MTRSNPGSLHPLDPEIDRTFHKRERLHRNSSIHIDSPSSTDFVHSTDIDSESFNIEIMANNRTLKELAAPDVNYQTLCIQYHDAEVPFVLKTGLIHLLARFHGLAGEDPHKHLKEFHIVCATMTPPGVPEEHVN